MFKRLLKFLGLNPSMSAMLVMVILLGLGEKMGERFLPVYLLAIGGSAYAVGLLNALDNFLSAIYAYVGGYISDLYGYKKALKLFTYFAMTGYFIVAVFPYWQAVLVGAIFFISWTALSLPAILSLISSTVKLEKQTMGVSVHSLIKRIPMAIGPILGGILISIYGIRTGARIAFVAAIVLGIVALWFIERYVEDKVVEREALPNIGQTFGLMSKDLKVLLISDIFVRFAEQLPYAFVVVWVMNHKGFSSVDFSILTLVEMVTAMIVYIPVAYLSERVSNKWLVVITFGFFTVFPLFLMISNSFPMLILAFVIRGLKEFGEPTRKALIVKLSPSGAKASTYGTYYLIRDIFVAAASLFSASLWQISPQTNLMTASAFGLLGTLVFMIQGKDSSGKESI